MELVRADQTMSYCVAQLLARRRGGGTAAVVSLPDIEERQRPAVDLIARDRIGLIAVEHTTIEPFAGLQRANALAGHVFPERYLAVPGLDAGSAYWVTLDPLEVEEARDLDHIGQLLRGWIERTAPRLSARQRVQPDEGELPLRASLRREPGAHGSPFAGRLALDFVAPRNREALRAERLLVALNAKLGKLHAVAADGLSTVLVLETFDPWLTNVDLVRTALKDASSRCEQPLSNYVSFVTTIGTTSLGWILHEKGTWPEETFVQLEPGLLITSEPQGQLD